MIEYATVADLQAWVPASVDIPDDAEQLLRSATLLVARAVNESPYEFTVVTNAGTEAKRDATCAQVVSWLASGIRPGTGGLQLGPVLKTKAIGTRRLEYDTNRTASAQVLAKREQVAERLAPEAETILRAAGILWVPVATATGGRGQCVAEGAEWPAVAWGGLEWWRS